MIRRPPRSTRKESSAASDVYKRQEQAIVGANEAFEITKKWSAGKRADMMKALYAKLEEHKERFIAIIINEGGKPRSYATNEIDRCLTTLRLAYEEATRFGGEIVPMDFDAGAGKTALTKRFPIGVIAVSYTHLTLPTTPYV